jgi:hypothetical protein
LRHPRRSQVPLTKTNNSLQAPDRTTLMKARLLLLIAAIALLLYGCSSVRLAYNTADFFIERYADDYLGLDGAQMERWSPTLETTLAQHREQELPYLAAFFDSAQNDARKGFDETDVTCLLDQFQTIYQRHFRLAAVAAGPLLAGLDKQQIDALERTFDKEAREDAKENAPSNIARRNRKRAERYLENLQWWIGKPSASQRAIVRDVTASMPDTGSWYAYRDAKRQELIALLRNGASAQRIERFLNHWLVDYRDMPASLQRARQDLRQGFTELLVRLDASLDEDQRRKFINRLTRLRSDFMALQRRPRMAAVDC